MIGLVLMKSGADETVEIGNVVCVLVVAEIARLSTLYLT